jgi:hypothetical protein
MTHGTKQVVYSPSILHVKRSAASRLMIYPSLIREEKFSLPAGRQVLSLLWWKAFCLIAMY